MKTEKSDKINLFLGLSAAGIQMAAYVIYNWQMFFGLSKPNPATWGLWLVVSTMNCLSYYFMSKDLNKIILPTASTVATFATFGYAVIGGKILGLNSNDAFVFGVSLLAAAVWWWKRSAGYANLLLQAAVALSFVPTFQSVWNNPSTERWLPWIIWSSAYILLGTIVVRKRKSWLDIVYPINGLVLHAVVGVLSLR